MAKNDKQNQQTGQPPANVPANEQPGAAVATATDANVGVSPAVSPPVAVNRIDPLLLWLADYQIKQIEPVQIKMMLRQCAEDLGLDQAERVMKRFAVARPNAAGVAKIGFEQVSALHRAREADRQRAEAKQRKEAEQPAAEMVA